MENYRKRSWLIIVIIFFIFGLIMIKLSTGKKYIRFHREIKTNLQPDTLWHYIEMAFVNSTESPLWPNNLEEIHSDGLKKNATITVTYKTPFTNSRFTYSIPTYEQGNNFSYQANPDHPLEGGGKVELIPIENGTLLRWSGEYTYEGFSVAALFIKLYFEKRFFRQLEANIRKLENGS